MAWQIGRSVPRENRRCTAGRYIKVRRANVSPAMTYAYGNADEPAKSKLSPSTLTASMCRRAWTWPDLSLENRKIVFRVSFLSQDIEYSRILNTLSEISPIIPVTKRRSWMNHVFRDIRKLTMRIVFNENRWPYLLLGSLDVAGSLYCICTESIWFLLESSRSLCSKEKRKLDVERSCMWNYSWDCI